jgi:hypothetical protein
MFARMERDRPRQELLEHIGSSVSRECPGFLCRLAGAPPEWFEKRKQLARGVDLAWQEAARWSGRNPDTLPFRPAPGVRS